MNTFPSLRPVKAWPCHAGPSNDRRGCMIRGQGNSFCLQMNRTVIQIRRVRKLVTRQAFFHVGLAGETSLISPRNSRRHGFMSASKAAQERYAEYMQSEHWIGLRSRALRAAGYQCECCTSESNLTVHHIHYRDLTDCTPADLIALCRRCHRFAHEAFRLANMRPMDYSRRQTIILIQGFVAQGKEPKPIKPQPRNLDAFNHRAKQAIHKCQNARHTPTAVRELIAELQTIVNTLRTSPPLRARPRVS